MNNERICNNCNTVNLYFAKYCKKCGTCLLTEDEMVMIQNHDEVVQKIIENNKDEGITRIIGIIAVILYLLLPVNLFIALIFNIYQLGMFSFFVYPICSVLSLIILGVSKSKYPNSKNIESAHDKVGVITVVSFIIFVLFMAIGSLFV